MERVQHVHKRMETAYDGRTVIHWYSAALDKATWNQYNIK